MIGMTGEWVLNRAAYYTAAAGEGAMKREQLQ